MYVRATRERQRASEGGCCCSGYERKTSKVSPKNGIHAEKYMRIHLVSDNMSNHRIQPESEKKIEREKIELLWILQRARKTQQDTEEQAMLYVFEKFAICVLHTHIRCTQLYGHVHIHIRSCDGVERVFNAINGAHAHACVYKEFSLRLERRLSTATTARKPRKRHFRDICARGADYRTRTRMYIYRTGEICTSEYSRPRAHNTARVRKYTLLYPRLESSGFEYYIYIESKHPRASDSTQQRSTERTRANFRQPCTARAEGSTQRGVSSVYITVVAVVIVREDSDERREGIQRGRAAAIGRRTLTETGMSGAASRDCRRGAILLCCFSRASEPRCWRRRDRPSAHGVARIRPREFACTTRPPHLYASMCMCVRAAGSSVYTTTPACRATRNFGYSAAAAAASAAAKSHELSCTARTLTRT
ncbi:unnamed protein product [Trichogramma brassicae]|uniref:Uncharacterized protein n=1 Tax=Trichogramma brassicae TaxID=86971 RepID=A0A6H5IW99_9HYME|nr:unnamed protein product [Trichogramma brassicae]